MGEEECFLIILTETESMDDSFPIKRERHGNIASLVQ